MILILVRTFRGLTEGGRGLDLAKYQIFEKIFYLITTYISMVCCQIFSRVLSFLVSSVQRVDFCYHKFHMDKFSVGVRSIILRGLRK